MTGLSGAGKSTLSKSLHQWLSSQCKAELLDGDEIRTNLSKGLGFSKEDRETNIKRIAFVANLLARNNVHVITATISPYQETRNYLKTKYTNFHEIYIKADIETVKRRDPKGLYEKVSRGEIKNFTGIDDPYEIPQNPSLVIDTQNNSFEKCLDKLKHYVGHFI